MEYITDEIQSKSSVKLDKITLTGQNAIILTKRPSVTAGVLHELTQIAEKPSGIYRETVLSIINEEYTQSKPVDSQQKTLETFFPVTPLSLSDAQLNVIKNVEKDYCQRSNLMDLHFSLKDTVLKNY